MQTQLLRTKLYIPPVRPHLVPRPRLTTRLDEGLRLGRKLTLISAPAGYGKTTLLSEWIASSEETFAWLSLDEDDNNPARFWTYLVSALQVVHPELDTAAWAALGAPQAKPPAIRPLLTPLINELDRLDLPLVLVLDDYHVITSPEIHADVAFLLEHQPSHIRLVLSSRADPPWPLARLRAQGALIELRLDDLVFSADECGSFWHLATGLDLPSDQLAALNTRTEGWAAGLQMAALSLAGQGSHEAAELVRSLTGSHRFILDYLLEEVLNRQTEDVQAFLLATSILDRMTAPLCNAVTGRDDSQRLLLQLEGSNLFLIPLDDERRWYRYHHLFADLLRHRLGASDPDRIAELHRLASSWYEREDLAAEAIEHALAAGDAERVAALVVGNAFAMVSHGELGTLLRWLDAVPAPAMSASPWLAVARAWALAYAGQVEKAEATLQQVESTMGDLSASDDATHLPGYLAAIRSYLADVQGELSEAVGLARRALALVPERDEALRGFTWSHLGTALRDSGDLSAAAHASVQALELARRGGDARVTVMTLCELAIVHSWQGRLHDSAANCREALALADEWGALTGRPLTARGLAAARLSYVLREWNQLDGALDYARQAVESAERWGQADLAIISYSALARVLRARGEAKGALRAMLQAEQAARDVSPWYGSIVGAWKARLQLAQGDLASASRWARESCPPVDDTFRLDTESECRTLTRVLLAEGRPKEALPLLDRLMSAAVDAGALGQRIEILVLQALALQAQGETDRAVAALGEALAQGEPENYCRIFLDEGGPLACLLRNAATQGIAIDYVGRLLSALEAETERPAKMPPQRLIDPLTERELEVLKLLTTHLSSTDIAHRLTISPNTVRTHIKNIYGKLGAHSRDEAVRTAEELRLV